MSKTFKERLIEKRRDGLEKTLVYFGSKTMIAQEIGLSRQAVASWWRRGKVSKIGAKKLEEYDPKYFIKEELRPDVKEWD